MDHTIGLTMNLLVFGILREAFTRDQMHLDSIQLYLALELHTILATELGSKAVHHSMVLILIVI